MKRIIVFFFVAVAICSMPNIVLAAEKEIVVVAGATGRTGQLVVKHLKAEGFEVRAMVRSMEKGERVLGKATAMVKADVTVPETLAPLLEGADYVISAIGTGGKAHPEDVDYKGSVALIEASKAAGIKKLIMFTSGGVTWNVHPLNWFSNDVRKWKRKAEIYLRSSGLTHVIVRPNGGLSDDPANTYPISFTQTDDFGGKITRDDVAVVCVKALLFAEADNKTFEIQKDSDGSFVKDIDWNKTFSELKVESDNF